MFQPIAHRRNKKLQMKPDDPPPNAFQAASSLRETKRAYVRRLIWTGFGIVALFLGLIGVILPVLPTTPFVLLAAFAFSKGSPRLRHWLVTHRTFGPIIADWEANGAIARPYKIMACSLMALAFAASVYAGFSTTILIIQAICLTGAATYVLTRPSGPA